MPVRTTAPARILLPALVALLALAAFAATPPAQALVWHSGSGRFAGLAPRHGVSARSLAGSVAASHAAQAPRTASATAATTTSGSGSGTLSYHSGPVLHASSPYLVFWDPAGRIQSSSRSLLTRYLSDSAADSGKASNLWAVDRQFTDSSGFADYRQTFSASQAIGDAQPLPARDATGCSDIAATYPNCVTDTQLQTELARLIGANSLPTGVSGSAPVYIVLTPGDTNVCTSATQCASNTFCAYHSAFQAPGGQTVLYAVVPLFFDGASGAQNPKACQADGNYAVQQPNGDLADVAIKSLSHEYSETITDPTGAGWWNTTTGNEDGDNCNYGGSADPAAGTSPTAFGPALGGSAAGSLYDQLIAGDRYYTQTEWSNGDSACDAQPAAAALSAAFTASAGVTAVGGTVSFDPSASSSAVGFTSSTWSFGDGSAPVFSRSASGPAAVQHTFTSAGAYTVTLTVVDADGDLTTTSRRVSVSDTPVAAFTPPAPTTGVAATFDGSASYDGGAPILTYSWDFGDGSHASGASAAHAYATPGSYTVTLTVTDALLRTASASHTVTVSDPPPPPPPPAPATVAPASTPVGAPTPAQPAAPATATPVTPTPVPPTAIVTLRTAHPIAGRPVALDGTRSSSAASYRWSFGDGTSATGRGTAHTYRRAGSYRVTLTVTDATGATARAARIVRVLAPATIARVSRSGHRTLVVVRVPLAGTVSLAGRSFRVTHPGTVTFALPAAVARIAQAGSAGALRIGFRPAA
jgi:PKD repeat protein